MAVVAVALALGKRVQRHLCLRAVLIVEANGLVSGTRFDIGDAGPVSSIF